MKKLKFLLFFLPLFITLNVSASTTTDIGYWTDYVDYGQFWFNPIPGSGDRYIILNKNDFVGNHTFSISNVYSMDLYLHNIPSQLQAQSGLVYELELSMPNAHFQNINQVGIGPSGGGMRCSIISFDNSNNTYPKVRFTCPSSYSSLQLSIYNSSLQNILTSTSLRLNYLFLREYQSNGTDTSVLEGQNQIIINQNDTIIDNQNSNTQDIIDNQNSNTQDIIDNQNSNTQDIIDNQNQNTKDEIINNQVCSDIPISKYVNNGSLSSNGSANTGSDFRYTNFIPISKYDSLKLISKVSAGNSYICFYNSSKTTISCISQQSLSVNNVITIPDNSSYFRATLTLRDNPPRPVWEYCRNGNQALNDSVNDLNDSITSEQQPNTSQDIEDMDDMVASDTPISDLITMPLTLINAYINGVNSSCSPVNLGNLYGTDLVLPCINLQQKLGSNLWGIIDALFSIFMCYNIGMLFVTAFDGITSLRDDFEGLYQPRHADNGYQPKHGG